MSKKQSYFSRDFLLTFLLVFTASLALNHAINFFFPSQPKQEVSAIEDFKKGMGGYVPLGEGDYVLENDKMRLAISQKGAQVTSVELKNHKGHNGAYNLSLLQDSNMDLCLFGSEESIHTSSLDFICKKRDIDGNQVLICTAELEGEGMIEITYTLVQGSHQVGVAVKVNGVSLDGPAPTLRWFQNVPPIELNSDESKKNLWMYYGYNMDSFLTRAGISSTQKSSYMSASKGESVKDISDTINWIALNLKYFNLALVAKGKSVFERGKIIIKEPSEKGVSHLKEVGMEIVLSSSLLQEGTELLFYFGPNRREALEGIAPNFEDNSYLGVTPFRHINKYIILPMANFLEGYLGNYLFVLLLMLLLFSLLQFPFLRSSYCEEVKQRPLAPMIAAIKAQYPDQPLQVQVRENDLKKKAGISQKSMLISGVLNLLVFISILQFVRYNIKFRQLSFLWIEDLSTYDTFYKLPFYIPKFGQHISLTGVMSSLFMIIPMLMKTRGKERSLTEKSMQYFFSVLMFVFFNSASAAFNIYRGASELIKLFFKLIFKLTTDEKEIEKNVLERIEKSASKVPTTSRSQRRYMDKKDKNNKN